MIAVAGVTGHTGGATASALLDAHRPVRVIVRDRARGDAWAARGAEVAVASLDDAAGLTEALRGTSAAYLLVPPIYQAPDLFAAQRAIVHAMAEAMARSGVGHVVFLSSIGGHLAYGTGPVRLLHEAEAALAATGRPLTVLRSSYLLENWAAVLGAVAAQGVLPSFIPLDQRMEMNGTADVGHEAARLLLGPPPASRRTVEMGGPRPTTPREIAAALSSLRGSEVTPVLVPLEQVVPTFASFGIPESTGRLLEEMYAAVASGYLAYEDPAAPHVRGRLTAADVLGPMLARSS